MDLRRVIMWISWGTIRGGSKSSLFMFSDFEMIRQRRTTAQFYGRKLKSSGTSLTNCDGHKIA